MRQRRWSLGLASILVTLASALAFALLWTNAGDRQPVLAVARPVPAGAVIEAADLTVVRVSADPGLRPLSADRRDEVIGQPASTDLVPGTLLTEAQLGEQTPLAEGEVVVGVALEQGRLPVAALSPGDRVIVVLTGSPAAPPDGVTGSGVPEGALGRPLAEARVLESVPSGDASSRVVVSLAADRSVAPDIAGASAGDRVSLVLAPSR